MVYFSPTGTTHKVLKGFLEGFQATTVRSFDLTLPTPQPRDFILKRENFAVIGAPVYGGRIPPVAAQRLRRFMGESTPAVIIVVYGNRAFEDALLELSNLVKECGFITVAAGAFIGEHSYSTAETPIAVGRPDAQDLIQARDFGSRVRTTITDFRNSGTMTWVPLPGTFPYKGYGAQPEISPVTRRDRCNLCGECADVCPTAAIAVDKTVLTEKRGCIRCCACVKKCPAGARVMEEPLIRQRAERLSRTYEERKAPEIFV